MSELTRTFLNLNFDLMSLLPCCSFVLRAWDVDCVVILLHLANYKEPCK